MPRPLAREEAGALAAALGRLGVISAATRRGGISQFRAIELARHQFVMRAGEPVRAAGLVLSGVLREYYLLEDGTERTRGFAIAGDAYGSAADALSGRAARVFTRTETAAVLAEIPWASLLALVGSSREWERMFHGLIQALYLRKAEREYQLLALDALARYQALRRDAPHLEQLVPQALIASYLGITPVHLSRLRRRLREGA